jgi:uncharacterized protein
MDGSLQLKLGKLKEIIGNGAASLVCYSGGVDSTLVASVAAGLSRNGAFTALIVDSPLMPPREFRAAVDLAARLGFPLQVLEANELAIPDFAHNPQDRCYLCKRYRLNLIRDWALSHGFGTIMDGSNADDMRAHRPGRRAALELGGKSPLEEAGIGKKEVRELARQLGLPNWDRPSRPCLATRFRHGAPLEARLLRRVDGAEELLEGFGLREFRVRLEGEDCARIEVAGDELACLLEKDKRSQLVKKFKELGFRLALLDLEGYRCGSMDET